MPQGYIGNETPTGAVNGVNTIFTLSRAPTSASLLQLFADGLLALPTTYTLAGATITFTVAPVLNTVLLASYYFGAATPGVINPGITNLVNIRTAARQRADMVGSQFLTDAEFNSNINASYQELYDLLVQKYGNDYYVALDSTKKPYQFTTNGTSEMFTLPDGSGTYVMPDGTTIAPAFFKGLGVDLQLSGSNDWVTLKPFPMIERNRFALPNMQAVRGRRTNLRYRFHGNLQGNAPVQYIWLRPLPMSGQIMQVWYIPRLTPLVNDSDSVDAVSGWEEYIVIDAAIKALQKEEGFEAAQVLMIQKKEMEARIEAAAENRDAGSPMVVGDARRSSGYGTYGEYSGGPEEEWL